MPTERQKTPRSDADNKRKKQDDANREADIPNVGKVRPRRFVSTEEDDDIVIS